MIEKRFSFGVLLGFMILMLNGLSPGAKIKITVNENFGEIKSIVNLFMIKNACKIVAEKSGISIVTSNDYDAELKVEVSGTALSQRYGNYGVSFGKRYTGAQITGRIIFKYKNKTKVNNFEGIESPSRTIPADSFKKPDNITFVQALLKSNFIEKLVISLNNISNVNKKGLLSFILKERPNEYMGTKKLLIYGLPIKENEGLYDDFIELLSIDRLNLFVRWRLIKLGKPVVPYLISALRRSEKISSNAASILGVIKDPKAVDTLIKILNNSNFDSTRYFAADALSNFIDHPSKSKIVEALCNALINDSNMYTRMYAARSLHKFKDKSSVGALIKALNDIKIVRKEAVFALKSIGTRRAKNALKEYNYK